jgi:NAD kinase
MNAAWQPAGAKAQRARRDKVVIVTRKTRLEELLGRFNTLGQVRFYLEHAGQDFAAIEAEHRRHHAVLDGVRHQIPAGVKHHIIDRSFLPQYTFGNDLVVTVGPDGLVVNTAKYLDTQPIVAINPDPDRIEGVLLPFTAASAKRALYAGLYTNAQTRDVTLAEAQLNDGQRLLAFNDLFIGARSHVSARYRIEVGGHQEAQSSSGVLVSTGAGSTGWLRSVYAGAARIVTALGGTVHPSPERLPWDAKTLVYAVREPWPSKTTGVTLVYGLITPQQPLVIHSEMAENGVIFSDGIESDYLVFTSGLTATVRIADRTAHLLLPQ